MTHGFSLRSEMSVVGLGASTVGSSEIEWCSFSSADKCNLALALTTVGLWSPVSLSAPLGTRCSTHVVMLHRLGGCIGTELDLQLGAGS